MSDRELDQLERDVQAARARVVADLAQLHGPNGHIQQLRDHATARVNNTKDSMVGRAKESVVDGIKGRIAANPGAALAIGAGIAWRLYRHPPIATALVGAGLVGLMRTDPEHPAMGSDAAARATHFATTARHRVQEWRGSDTGEHPSGGSDGAQSGERSGGYVESARGAVSGYADTARQRLGEWGSGVDRAVHRAARAADRWTAPAQRSVRRVRGGQMEGGDRILLGAAAMALAAAVGLAAGRGREEVRRPVYAVRIRRRVPVTDLPPGGRVRRSGTAIRTAPGRAADPTI